MDELVTVTLKARVRSGWVEVFEPGESKPILVFESHFADGEAGMDPATLAAEVAGAIRGAGQAQKDLAVHQATVRGERPQVIGPDRTSPED